MRPTPECEECRVRPEHSRDCATKRGRLLARYCKCGRRFSLYSSKSNRVNCPKCIEAKPKRPRASKPKRNPGLTLAEHRARLECEAFSDAPLRRILSYGALKHAVGQRLGACDRCGGGCDVSDATLATIDLDEAPSQEDADLRYVSGVDWRRQGEIDLILCATCGLSVRSPYAPSYVISWIWGVELGDADTRRAAGLLAR